MNKLVIISGPSGSGKSTITKSVMTNEVVSFTTRPRRPGEVDGKDYIFLTQAEFDFLLNSNQLAEHTTYYGNASYGITLAELHYKLSLGHAFVIVDVAGMEQLKKLWDNSLTIFIRTDEKNARARMIDRGDAPERITSRLKTFEEEQENFYLYDWLLDNDEGLTDSIEGMKKILHVEGVL